MAITHKALRQRVEKGAAFLDEHHPGWRTELNLSRLNLNDCSDCVLGQLYGYWDTGKMILDLNLDATISYGFAGSTGEAERKLTDIWLAYLQHEEDVCVDS